MSETAEPVKIERVLVAIDGSEYSNKAVRYACALGSNSDMEIILLYVVSMLVSATPYNDTVSDQPFLALQRVGEDILSRAKDLANSLSCDVTDLITYGDPATRIIEIAEEREVDLIVMGSRGISGIKRLFVGSVSDKVVNQAPCPVLLVR